VNPAPRPRSARAGLELTFDDPCVLFALRRESRAFRREFRPYQRFPGAPCRAKFCGPAWLSVLVAESGLGQAQTERALAWLLSTPKLGDVPYRPKLVLAAGFCGALHEGLQTGELVLATEILDAASGERWATTWPGELPAGPWEPALHRGRLVTVPSLAATADEKRFLGKEHDAVVVDMESAAVARRCREADIPFGCLRVVVDDLVTPLSPALAALVARGPVSVPRLAWAVVKRPRLVGELWGLARRSRTAAASLGRALGEVLTLTLPWAQD
jgi:adenosylhomocysteine nucleosidase